MADPLEIKEKENRVRAFLGEKGYRALFLKRQANFSWITCGGLNVVGIASEIGAASVLILPDAKFVISNNIEAPRLAEEEGLVGQGYELRAYDWYDEKEVALVRELAGQGKIASDSPLPGADVIPDEIARLRYSLTPQEIERYKWLGLKTSEALERIMEAVRPGQKECEVIGALAEELWRDRIDYVTLMAAADERISRFRHPIPSEKRIDKYFMLSANTRKWGLIVSLTRFVHFGKLPEELRSKYEANVRIDCTMMAATRPGVEAREVLIRGIECYKEMGFPDEWKLHHQGGATGYTGRDYRTNFDTKEIVQNDQPFTWNPSITGTKSEDTILATKKGPVLITHPVTYPTMELEVDGMVFRRPCILEK